MSTDRGSDKQPDIINNVTIQQNTRGYEIIGTLLFCGALGMVAWVLDQSGWGEIAATALTVFLVQLVKLLLVNGWIAVPSTGTFSGTAGLLRTALSDLRDWLNHSRVWRLVAIATAYTLAFMVMRATIGWALGIFGNPWIAGAAASLLAALIVFPKLLSKPMNAMRSRDRGAEQAPSNQTTTTTDEEQR